MPKDDKTQPLKSGAKNVVVIKRPPGNTDSSYLYGTILRNRHDWVRVTMLIPDLDTVALNRLKIRRYEYYLFSGDHLAVVSGEDAHKAAVTDAVLKKLVNLMKMAKIKDTRVYNIEFEPEEMELLTRIKEEMRLTRKRDVPKAEPALSGAGPVVSEMTDIEEG